ncbi:fluoride efflux transporter CrcB [Oxalobacter sp. OttesenSCG-928-P03]|nr:fluoride efflux transporter CrcB [Oxalobacter sp. OttesenSCG-928-P03]
MIYSILSICIGAATGALLRWGLGISLNALFPAIPPGTLVANLAGAFLIGLCLAFFAHSPNIAGEWRLLVITGFLGSLTTFSTFSAEVVTLIQQGRLLMACTAASIHLFGSLGMTFLGLLVFSLLKRTG